MKKLTIYRKRPDLVTITIPLADSESDEPMEVALHCVRPNTPQQLNLIASMQEIQRSVNARKEINAAVYSAQVVKLVELVHSVDGLADEDGAPLAWNDLKVVEQEELLLALPVAAMVDLFGELSQAGRLDAAQKKSSGSTQPSSTPEEPADAPSASAVPINSLPA